MNQLEFNIVFWSSLLFGAALQWSVSNAIRAWRQERNRHCKDCGKRIPENGCRMRWLTGKGKRIYPICMNCFNKRMGM